MKALSLLRGIVRGTRTLHAVMMVIVGYILRPDLLNSAIANLILPIISVIFLWQFTTMLNDIYDVEIDRTAHPDRPLASGEMSVKRYFRWSLYALAVGLLFSLLGGFITTLLGLTYAFLAVIYSVPPVRIRNRWYGTAIIGLGSDIYFAMGYWTHSWILDGSYFSVESMNYIAASVGLIIIFSLSIAPNITAYRDYEGDVKAGVSTIYTILGKERGKTAVGLGTFVLFILPAFLFFTWWNIAISAILGIFASIFFMKYECYNCVFGAYFAVLLWYLFFILSWSF